MDPCGSSCLMVGTMFCVILQGDQTEGRIRTAHLGEDVLRRSGAALLRVEGAAAQGSPEAPQVSSTTRCFQVITQVQQTNGELNGEGR